MTLWDPARSPVDEGPNGDSGRDGNFRYPKRYSSPPLFSIRVRPLPDGRGADAESDALQRAGILSYARFKYIGRRGAPQRYGDVFCAAWAALYLAEYTQQHGYTARGVVRTRGHLVAPRRRRTDLAYVLLFLRQALRRRSRLRRDFVEFLRTERGYGPRTIGRILDVLTVSCTAKGYLAAYRGTARKKETHHQPRPMCSASRIR